MVENGGVNMCFTDDLNKGECLTVEFKSWIKCSGIKECIKLVVPELISFSNTKGGTVYLGVEDDGEVTGCTGQYDIQSILDAIYDMTRPPLFPEAEEIKHDGKIVIALHVDNDGLIHTTTDGKCLKRLGKNNKPWYPEEMSHRYATDYRSDFSSKVITNSDESDINRLEIYKLKEKLRIRDSASTLSDMDDMAFLKDLGLIVYEGNQIHLTIAGLLFVGKETSIKKLLPQVEVIYLKYENSSDVEYSSRLDLKQPIITVLDRLTEKMQNENKITNVQIGLFRVEISDYSEKVFQEALLNALSHRDYESMASIYVKHYPDHITIENPGGFLDGINENNIITHASSPRNKLIVETLQRLKYVQRTGQGVDIIYREILSMGKPYPVYTHYSDSVQLTIYSANENLDFVKFIIQEQESKQIAFSLAELMILRYVVDNKKIILGKAIEVTQAAEDEVRHSLKQLQELGILEVVGKQYNFTSRVYECLSDKIHYVQDKTVTQLKAKHLITEYLEKEGNINKQQVMELCGFSDKQARTILRKLIEDEFLVLLEKGKYSKYGLRK